MGKLALICLLTGIFLLCLAVVHAVEKNKDIKKNWSIVPFPALSYNSDLGFQYGAFCDVYDYGDGKIYPNYRHKISVEVSRFTKGSGVYRFFYDSKFLIRNTRLTFDAGYLPDKMLDFYGFNGYASPYEKGRNKSFYKMNRDMLRLTLDFQRPIAGKWAWAAGVGYYNYRMGKVKLKKYQDEISLYQLYASNGIINTDEAGGGNILQLKAGVVYDSRDIESDPAKGIWGETILCASPDLIDRKEYHHLKLSVVFRQYLPVWKDKLTFAYRLGYQGTLAGKSPFYVQSNINTIYMRQTYSEGLGGTTSLRGVLRNRIVGNGMAWVNTEFRFRFFNFQLLKQNWYFVINPLLDAGMIVDKYREKRLIAAASADFYSGDAEKLHMSAGIGAKAVMNHNFVLSVEWGKAFDKRDGNSGLNLYMNFLF